MNEQLKIISIVLLGVIVATAAAAPLPRFPNGSVWNQDVSGATLHPDSTAMIATLSSLDGFGNGRMQIDFSLHVVRADPDAPTRTIIANPNGYFLPDCEPLGSEMPVPLNAAIEEGTDLDCDNLNSDCHLLVVQGNTLYEAYGARGSGNSELEAQCLAIWQLDFVYPPEGRGDHCTSADAAGFPMAPLMFNADDIAASLAMDAGGGGDLGHAIRFVLPNSRMASDNMLPGAVFGRLYVRPASHAGGPSGPIGSVPYGVLPRLRSDFPLTNYSPAARVLLNSFKRYGIVLADGGTIALTAESDLYTTTQWADLDIDSRIFDQTSGAMAVAIDDFEVINTGERIAETYDCVRSVILDGIILNDGFE